MSANTGCARNGKWLVEYIFIILILFKDWLLNRRPSRNLTVYTCLRACSSLAGAPATMVLSVLDYSTDETTASPHIPILESEVSGRLCRPMRYFRTAYQWHARSYGHTHVDTVAPIAVWEVLHAVARSAFSGTSCARFLLSAAGL